MVGEDDDRGKPLPPAPRKAYLRSVSWTDRSPSKPNPNPRAPANNSKARLCLPPLQPLSVSRQNVEEWPKAGSDDLGVWPNIQTPRGGSGNPGPGGTGSGMEFQFKRDKLAFFDKECSKIADHIYLGSDAVAKNRETLRQNGITHVLNCVGFVSPEYFREDLVYKTLWLQDSPSEDITSILYDVFDYFEDVREQGGRVLVHCCQGVSRSTSLVIAYLMWRDGQSFEDAFQYVKAARGVTNPNMGFACQLLQRQKRVNFPSPNSARMIRMYRMAPHSPYDPLHLVPKQLGRPGAKGLDSRGAFIVHVPDAIYVWVGKECKHVMSNKAMDAAFQVIRYERAKGPILRIGEGEEPSEFWNSLANMQLLSDGDERVEERTEESSSRKSDSGFAIDCVEIGGRRVKDYDLDFEIFHKALAGGVVPIFSVSNTDTEMCLPARENGWDRLRQKFASGLMREYLTSLRLKGVSNSAATATLSSPRESEESDHMNIPSSPLTPSTHPCGSPDSLSCFLTSSPQRISDTGSYREEEEGSITSSPDSYSRIPIGSPIFSSKSPTLSPSTSDYSGSSFTFSPSSSNWSDLPYQSSQQPSPSGLESAGPALRKDIRWWDKFPSPSKDSPASPREVFPADQVSRVANSRLEGKGILPSIAERRGSNPPPRMRLPSVDEQSHVHRKLVRPWSFSLPDLGDDVMQDADHDRLEDGEDDGEVLMMEADADPVSKLDGEMLAEVEEGKSFHLSTLCR
ncbi:protein-tyrosine-phosphatase MKP1-like [Punica granatum]|nr:protein-tyrosine-phosphatase MKP1-like [Punica granatum]